MSEPETEGEKAGTYLGDLRELLQAPRELWLTYLALLFEYVGLYSFLSTLSLWLTSDFHFDDNRASYWFGVFGALLSLFAFTVGSIADVIGTRKTLIFSFAAAMLTRSVMCLAPSPLVALPALIAYAFAFASSAPVLQAAVHKYSTKRTTTIAFSLFYLSFNIGGALAGPVIDWTKDLFVDATTHRLVLRDLALPIIGEIHLSAYRAIIGVGTVTALIGFIITLFVREDSAIPPRLRALSRVAEPGESGRAKNPLLLLKEVVADSAFWRFMLLMGLLVLVKAIYVHMQSTWPKYITRERGEDFAWGELWALNSWLILVLTPAVASLTRKISAYKVMVFGTFITAASPFVFALGTSTAIQVSAIVVLTIGEAFWSPRSYEYTVSIAPKGSESTYAALASLPYFVAKFFVAMVAGRLLTAYCPPEGARDSSMLWIIIGAMTLCGPVGLVLFRSVVNPRKAADAPA